MFLVVSDEKSGAIKMIVVLYAKYHFFLEALKIFVSIFGFQNFDYCVSCSILCIFYPA